MIIAKNILVLSEISPETKPENRSNGAGMSE